MIRFLLPRLLYAALVVFGVVIAVFFLVRLGGDPSALFLPPESSAADIARFRHQMGFDRTLSAQFLDFLAHTARGDFGRSLRYDQPALGLVLERMPATLQLSAAALALSLILSIPVAILAALHRDTAIDRGGLLLSLIGQSFPTFWLSLMLILIFSEKLGLLPPSGRGTWQQLLMPALSLAVYSTGIITRLLRSSMIEVLQADFVRTARSKGVCETRVVLVHALRNAVIPTLTVIGLQVGALLGGAVITEEIFAYPGVGRLAIQAIATRDFTIIQAFVVLMAVVIVSINLLVDIGYAVLDPRLRQA